MAKVLIKGLVMEVYSREILSKEEKTKLISEGKIFPKVDCVRIYQKGEKNLIEIKNINKDEVSEGSIATIDCKVVAWSSGTYAGLSFTSIEQ